MATEKTISVTFKLADAKCTEFNLLPYGKTNKAFIASDEYEFEFKSHMNFDFAIDTSTCFFETTLLHKKKEGNEPLAVMKSSCSFKILNFNEVIVRGKDQSVNIPDHVISSFSGITLSTARGIMIIKLENTLYSNALIPVVDPASFIPKRK